MRRIPVGYRRYTNLVLFDSGQWIIRDETVNMVSLAGSDQWARRDPAMVFGYANCHVS